MKNRVRPGFTIVELLVVVSIIALLIAILLPALAKAKNAARMTMEISNMRQVGISILAYATDHNGVILANNAYPYDSSKLRKRLCKGYLNPMSGSDQYIQVWGCPFAVKLTQSQNCLYGNSWYYNVGNKGAVTVDGQTLSNNRIGSGYSVDDYEANADGRGFYLGSKAYPHPSDIIMLTDAGFFKWYMYGAPSSTSIVGSLHHPTMAYDQPATTSASWALDGHALQRSTNQLNRFAGWAASDGNGYR